MSSFFNQLTYETLVTSPITRTTTNATLAAGANIFGTHITPPGNAGIFQIKYWNQVPNALSLTEISSTSSLLGTLLTSSGTLSASAWYTAVFPYRGDRLYNLQFTVAQTAALYQLEINVGQAL